MSQEIMCSEGATALKLFVSVVLHPTFSTNYGELYKKQSCSNSAFL